MINPGRDDRRWWSVARRQWLGAMLLIACAMVQAQSFTPLGPGGGLVTALEEMPDGSLLASVYESTPFRSLDGGQSWTRVDNGFGHSFGGRNKLLRIGARVYSMQNQEIAYSLDNGVSLGGFCHWAPGAVRDIATDGAGVLYVASANGLFVSADGCATFTLRNAEDDIHWLHVDGSHLLATREFGTVLRSADGGQTFVTENSLTGAQAFHAVGGGVTYAADADFIYRRTGPALPFQLLAAIGNIRAFAGTAANLFAVGDTGIFRSTNGTAWTARPYPSSPLRFDQVLLTSTGAVLAGGFGGMVRAATSSADFVRAEQGMHARSIFGLHRTGGRVLLFDVFDAMISNDDGASFNRINDGLPLDVRMVSALLPNGRMLVEAGGRLYRRDPADGIWWNSGNDPSSYATALATFGNAQLYLGEHPGMVYRSSDGGSNFTPLSNPPAGMTSPRVLRTDASGQVWAMTFSSVYRSTDAGASFTEMRTGLPSTFTTRNLVVGSDGRIWLSLIGGALYRLNAGGSTWQAITLPAGMGNFNRVLAANAQRILVSTFGAIWIGDRVDLVAPSFRTVSDAGIDTCWIDQAAAVGDGEWLLGGLGCGAWRLVDSTIFQSGFE